MRPCMTRNAHIISCLSDKHPLIAAHIAHRCNPQRPILESDGQEIFYMSEVSKAGFLNQLNVRLSKLGAIDYE